MLDALKHEPQIPQARTPPRAAAGVDYWDSDCCFGLSQGSADPVRPADRCVDEAAKGGATQVYVEIGLSEPVRGARQTAPGERPKPETRQPGFLRVRLPLSRARTRRPDQGSRQRLQPRAACPSAQALALMPLVPAAVVRRAGWLAALASGRKAQNPATVPASSCRPRRLAIRFNAAASRR